MEGLLVRFYEAARAIHADLFDHRNGNVPPDWDSRTLDHLLQSLGTSDDDSKWACLLQLIRNDIVHNRGIACPKTEAAAAGLSFPAPPDRRAR